MHILAVWYAVISTLPLVTEVSAGPLLASTSARGFSFPFSLADNEEYSPQHRIYVVNVTIEDRSFEVILDTGSSDLWIDTNATASPEPLRADDSTLIDTGLSVLLEYGVKDVYTYALGNVQYGDIHIPLAEDHTKSIIVHNQSFVNVPGTTNITRFGNQGILGLGPPRGWSAIGETLRGTQWLADDLISTFFQANQDLEQYYTLAFSPRDTAGMVHDGVVTFSDVIPPLSTVLSAPKLPLVTGQFWDVPSKGFVVNGETLNFEGSKDLTFVLDSGVYAVFAPPEYVEAIYAPVPGSFPLEDGTWHVPCDTILNVSVTLGDVVFPIHPIDMTEVYEVQDGEAQCQGLFQSNTDTYLPFLIGLNVLRDMYVLHHYADSREAAPYIQAISTLDVNAALAGFDSMNTARIEDAVASWSRTYNISNASPTARPTNPSGITVSVDTKTGTARLREQYIWHRYVQAGAILVSSVSIVVLYTLWRRVVGFRRKRNGQLLP